MNARGASVNETGAAWAGGISDASESSGAPRGLSAAAPTTRGGGRPLDVYLVEDNVHVLEGLIAALEELAPIHVVGTAADEGVAVDWLKADGEPCDLVIVDIFLRSGSGLGVIAAARRRRPQTKLVVLSNYATDEMRARCLAGGADRVFDKSRDIDMLIAFCIALARGDGNELPH